MTEQIDAELLSSLDSLKNIEGLGEKENLLVTNTTILTVIVCTILKSLETDSTDRSMTIFLVVQNYLRGILPDKTRSVDASALFVYYLEAHAALSAIQNKTEEKPNKQILLNEAALSLFDLYLAHPTSGIIRRLLCQSANALHEVVSATQTKHAEVSMKQSLSDLSNLAMLSQTLKSYIKGLGRTRNYAYVAWLKALFGKLLCDPDLSFMTTDAHFKDILAQVVNRASVIKLNKPS